MKSIKWVNRGNRMRLFGKMFHFLYILNAFVYCSAKNLLLFQQIGYLKGMGWINLARVVISLFFYFLCGKSTEFILHNYGYMSKIIINFPILKL